MTESPSEQVKPSSSGAYQTIAVIDIGTTLVRMAVAEVKPDGTFEILEKLQRVVWLGQDTFQHGRLSRQTIHTALAVLRDYRRLLDFYGITHVRAVATSAVREALNADAFVDRAYMVCGIDVEVIDTAEESRLAIGAVRASIPPRLFPEWKKVLIAEVGGGSTLLTMLQGNEIIASQSLPLGSIRLKEVLFSALDAPQQMVSMLRLRIDNELKNNISMMPSLHEVQTFIMMGGDARFTARKIGKSLKDSEGILKVSAKSLKHFIKDCQNCTVELLAEKFNLAFSDAQTLLPALVVYEALINLADAKELLVSPATMRDGLLLDLTGKLTGREDPMLAQGIIRSAETIAGKYQTDMAHVEHVSRFALALFDALQGEHRLDGRARVVLHVAGLLHDIGHFLSPRAHHKHSYYLILNSEIFGLSRDEVVNAALISRYHRRSVPKTSHAEYITLSRERRMVISKLAAILRVADALDTGHQQHIGGFRCEIKNDELVLHIANMTDLTLERRSLAFKGDLFTEIFGLKVRLEEQWLGSHEGPRSEPMPHSQADGITL